MNEKTTIRFVLTGVKYSQSDLGKHYKTFCGLYTKRFVEVSRNVLRFIQQTAMYQNASRCVIRLVSRLRPQEKSP